MASTEDRLRKLVGENLCTEIQSPSQLVEFLNPHPAETDLSGAAHDREPAL